MRFLDNLSLPFQAKGSVELTHKTIKTISQTDTFGKGENKIVTTGFFKKKCFVAHVNEEDGILKYTELQTAEQELKKIKKLLDDGVIDENGYNKLLDKIISNY